MKKNIETTVFYENEKKEKTKAIYSGGNVQYGKEGGKVQHLVREKSFENIVKKLKLRKL